MTEAASGNLIELRVDTLAQLFHTLDPFPFRERDLDREAEEFIVGWARELVADRTLRIVVHFPETEAQTKAARELSEAFRRYFFDHARLRITGSAMMISFLLRGPRRMRKARWLRPATTISSASHGEMRCDLFSKNYTFHQAR